MKKISLVLLLCVLVLFSAGCSKNDPFKYAKEADLVEQYGLTFEAGIWNDYMPPVANDASVHFVQFTTTDENLTGVEMSVEILTSSKRFVRTFKDIYNGATTPWGAYDYRATKSFRLGDGENWTMNVTIKIGNEKQTVILTGTVGTTH